jgi:hypothetical protein
MFGENAHLAIIPLHIIGIKIKKASLWKTLPLKYG